MKNIDLIETGLDLLKTQPGKTTAVSATTLVQRYDPNSSKLHAYLLAARLPIDGGAERDVLQLFRKMEPLFNESELQTLSFELNVNYEDLNGRTYRDKLRELITYLQRRQRLPDLLNACQQQRPRVEWELDTVTASETAVQPKLNIAVVVDIARPALRNVATYLDDHNQDMHFILFRHVEPGQFFSPHDDWPALAATFGDVMARVKRTFDGAKSHFFMAGPGGLLFAMGCIWGTVDEALVYHYENDTYYPVLPITRKLRQTTAGWA